MRTRQHRKGAARTSVVGSAALLVAGLALVAAQTEAGLASLAGNILSGLAAGFGAIPVPLLMIGALTGAVCLWLRWR